MLTPTKKTIALADGREISIETGRLAKQADGAVELRFGNTMLLATVCSAKEAEEGADFMPLQVEYKEKYSSVGRYPGGFTKREGRPSDNEILTARLVDRVLRPLFPSNYHANTIVNVILFSSDGVDQPDAFAGLAASAAIAVSDVPFEEPIADTNERDRVRFAHSIDIPITGDESNFTIYDIAHQIDIDACSILMIKIPRSGFTYGRKIAALCEAFHRPMMIGSQSESALGAMAIIHMGCGLKTISYPCEFMDFDNPRASLINEKIDMHAGRVYPSDKPGLGVTLNEDAVAEYTVEL